MKSLSLSIRLLWPFARLMCDYAPELRVLQRAGVPTSDLANPDARLPETLVMELMRTSLAKTGNPALGLHAGGRVDVGDFGVMECVARSGASLREALQCCSRYMRLLDEGTRAELFEHGDTASWQLHPLGIEREPAVNDFAVVAAMLIGQRLIGLRAAPLEVHFVHRQPTNAAEYARVFGCPIRLGQSSNAIVMPRKAFDLPLVNANRDLFAAFDLQARRQLSSMSKTLATAERVYETVSVLLDQRRAGMPEVAKRLHMSVATLRRRLEDEGTSHREIVDRARHTLALRHVRDGRLAVSDVAFLLGFSSVQAFSRAFRRWTCQSPAEYRASRQPKPDHPEPA